MTLLRFSRNHDLLTYLLTKPAVGERSWLSGDKQRTPLYGTTEASTNGPLLQHW